MRVPSFHGKGVARAQTQPRRTRERHGRGRGRSGDPPRCLRGGRSRDGEDHALGPRGAGAERVRKPVETTFHVHLSSFAPRFLPWYTPVSSARSAGLLRARGILASRSRLRPPFVAGGCSAVGTASSRRSAWARSGSSQTARPLPQRMPPPLSSHAASSHPPVAVCA